MTISERLDVRYFEEMRLMGHPRHAGRASVRTALVLLVALPCAVLAQQSPAAMAEMAGMSGFYGAYDMTREGSGTSWQPESTPMSGLATMKGDWLGMADAFVNLIYD